MGWRKPSGGGSGGAAVPAFRTAAYQQFTSTHNPTFTIPAASKVGDYCVAIMFTNDTAITSPPTGWSTIISSFGSGCAFAAFAKTLVGGDPGGTASGIVSSGSTGFGCFNIWDGFSGNGISVGNVATATVGGQSISLPTAASLQPNETLLGFISANGSNITVPGTMLARSQNNESNFSNLQTCVAETFVTTGNIPTETFTLALSPSQFIAQATILLVAN